MSVETVTKIYMPKHETGEYLYGLKTVETKENDNKDVVKIIESFYVIKCAPASQQNSHLDFIGTLSKQRTNVQGISILLDSNENVIRLLKDGRELTDQQVLLIYYDKTKFLNSYDAVQNATTTDNNFALVLAKALNADNECENGPSTVSRVTQKLNNILIATTGVASTILSVAAPVFKNTVIHRHCCNWKKCLVDKRTMNGFLLLDVMLGIMFFLIMNHIQHSGRYFMDSTEFIVKELRRLLEMLDGSPAGLKLNVQLNNFLLSCFMYHVDLWWNFIVIVEPAVHYLFFPITMFGLMGFSFQCAMLCDVITLITLHAHCFYIYAAMLYKLELSSIRSLLRIVLGRRLNVLKNRVESQDYTNRQLFLATLFFTTLLFLLPTIIIYYFVFASLRFSIYCLSYILMSIQNQILMFPFHKYLRWIAGSYVEASKISMKCIASRKLNNVQLLELELSLKSCFPWTKSSFAMKTENYLPKPMSIERFAKCLLKGEMMAFSPRVQM